MQIVRVGLGDLSCNCTKCIGILCRSIVDNKSSTTTSSYLFTLLFLVPYATRDLRVALGYFLDVAANRNGACCLPLSFVINMVHGLKREVIGKVMAHKAVSFKSCNLSLE